jgi:hypothetical protein
MIADLAPFHVRAQDRGIAANGIANYKRSHDLAWTACFLLLCAPLTDEGFTLLPDWEESAAHAWKKMAQEIKQGVYPDFDRP